MCILLDFQILYLHLSGNLLFHLALRKVHCKGVLYQDICLEDLTPQSPSLQGNGMPFDKIKKIGEFVSRVSKPDVQDFIRHPDPSRTPD
jgi:hypothetical protein